MPVLTRMPTIDPVALERARWVRERFGVNISKSSLGSLRRCPRAYAWERIEKRPASQADTLAQLRGTATHKAIERVLKSTEGDSETLVRETLAHYPDLADDDELLVNWALDAVDMVRGRGGQLVWVEELLKLDRGRSRGWTLWAAVDCAVESEAGLEVIDWKTTAKASDEWAVVEAESTAILRLVAGANSQARPIRITEAHLPSGAVVTVEPGREQFEASVALVDAWCKEFASELTQGGFPATPGSHCGGCDYRDICPAVAS